MVDLVMASLGLLLLLPLGLLIALITTKGFLRLRLARAAAVGRMIYPR
jgi:hypothetical protein